MCYRLSFYFLTSPLNSFALCRGYHALDFTFFLRMSVLKNSDVSAPDPQVVRVVTWEPRYNKDFVRLNRQWIECFFKLEPSDLNYFSDPEGLIIRPGGEIFIALLGDEAVGCCALVHHADTDLYELAKMAVDPSAQGHGIGTRLGHALIDYARAKGISLGFKPVPIEHAVYDRCDLFMEWHDECPEG
jgi:GNAT superfamily N-acetyltransferase